MNHEIDAQKVYGYALYKDGRSSKLPYPLENFHPDVAGRSFHHGRFIQKLRKKAASLPKYDFLALKTIVQIVLIVHIVHIFHVN